MGKQKWLKNLEESLLLHYFDMSKQLSMGQCYLLGPLCGKHCFKVQYSVSDPLAKITLKQGCQRRRGQKAVNAADPQGWNGKSVIQGKSFLYVLKDIFCNKNLKGNLRLKPQTTRGPFSSNLCDLVQNSQNTERIITICPPFETPFTYFKLTFTSYFYFMFI